MKLIIITTLLIFPSLASARIGEDPKQCMDRYGKPFSVDKAKGTIYFSKSGFLIAAHFFNGKCDQLLFTKQKENEKISENEVEALLNANAQKGQWSKPTQADAFNKTWLNEKARTKAQLETIDRTLCIYTLDQLKRQQADKKKKEDKNLNDF